MIIIVYSLLFTFILFTYITTHPKVNFGHKPTNVPLLFPTTLTNK